MKIRLYRHTQDVAYRMDEQGAWFSFEPYNSNSPHYQGDDDRGKDYILLDGYTIGESQDGEKGIYDNNGHHVRIVERSGKPHLAKPHLFSTIYTELKPA